jgi:hypothetical protein
MEKLIVPASEYWPGFGTHRRDIEGLTNIASIGCLGQEYLHAAPLKFSDGGRSKSRRPRQKNDCTVVALANATGADYDTCYDTLAKAGRKCSRGFSFRVWAKTARFEGWSFREMSFPAVKGMRRVNPASFALKHTEGRFILKVSKHVMACVDGVIVDAYRSAGDRCVYGAWELVRDAS